ncbi:MAG: hypothetical protein ACOX4I_01955 [Anaerovoracaceae bacterium]|jgi:hypothetical protein
MLGKLLKYEFQAMGRILLPIYGILLVLGALFGLSMRWSDDFGLRNITLGSLYVFGALALIIITLIMIIQRFYKNLLGNEGYLMFCLPATTGQHVANKIISATAWIIIGGIIGILSTFIFTACSGFVSQPFHFDYLYQSFEKAGLVFVELILLIIVSCADSVAKIFASIAIGHQWHNHRILGAVLSYVGLSVAEMIVSNIIMHNITHLTAYLNHPASIAVMETYLLLLLVVVSILLAVYWFVTWYLLNKKLNLE